MVVALAMAGDLRAQVRVNHSSAWFAGIAGAFETLRRVRSAPVGVS